MARNKKIGKYGYFVKIIDLSASDKKFKLKKLNDLNHVRNAWLSPDGTFYACRFQDHDHVAEFLGEGVYLLESKGWLHLSNGCWFDPKEYLAIKRIKKARIEITQSQKDAVFDWCIANNIKVPSWLLEESFLYKANLRGAKFSISREKLDRMAANV